MSDTQADSLDHASDVESSFRDWAIAELRRPLIPPEGFNGVDCVDCDEPIVAARLKMGKFTCIYCQEGREKKKIGFSR